MAATPPEPEEHGDEAQSEPSLSASAGETLRATRRLGRDIAELLGLEARLAALTLLRLAMVTAAVAVLGLTAWTAAQAAAAVALIELGLPVAAVLAGLAVVNGICALILLRWSRGASRHLAFRASRRAIFGEVSESDEPRA